VASHIVTAQAQVRGLAKAVSAAFDASNLTDAEKSPGRIELTDLPWQAPPLITPAKLAGAALQDYFDVPLDLDGHQLQVFWVKALHDMWFTPGRLLRRGTFVHCGWSMPRVKVGQRAFRFATPAGWPVCDEHAGVQFSLEVAHAARVSLPVKRVVSTSDSYYVELADGGILGVVDGLPACQSPWKVSAAGLVPDMLVMPRGDASYVCAFDQIASLRSVLHTHYKRFPNNFEALDHALQALRLLSLGGYCPELLHQMRAAPIDMMVVRERERALRDALDVIASSISDRAKLQTLHGLLVPAVMGVTLFKKHIFAGDQYPFTLARGKIDTIRAWLEMKYQDLPEAVRTLKI